MRLLLCWLVVTCATACNKPATPGALADFEPRIGTSKFKACTDENDGKRFSLRGYLVIDGDVRVSDGKVTLSLYEDFAGGSGGGARTFVELEDGRHVTFDVKDVKWKSAGYRSQEGRGRLEGVTFHTTSGDAAPGEPVTAIVELSVQRVFQQKELFGCELTLLELKKG